MALFRPVSSQVHFPEMEEEVLGQWKAREVFRRSVEDRPRESRYIFYDGPPFATGLPHYGHLVASTLKDIVPRYWAMRGHRVERRFGWDTHGLPIEMEMEKQLGLSGPSEIRAFGVGAFNEACRANVLRYTAEWERVVGRLGRWVDFANDYKTMDASFMESVWWVFRELWDRGLVYEDFRVMPFSWRLSTSLSNFEANMDYRDVQDPALTVIMPLVDEAASLLIWTTTPWTLPSNLAVAVGPELAYVRARRAGDEHVYIVAEARVQAVLGKDAEVLAHLTGAELVGRRYVPLFDDFADRGDLPEGQGGAFRVIAAPHVTTTDGTGLVHMAPDFGEDDFQACRAVGIGVLRSVDDEGRFTSDIKLFAGRNVKEADPDIIKLLKDRGRVLKHETIQHSYPFCWRSDTPLIYRAVPARFIKVEALRERMQAHNQGIHWVPEAVGQKRFGNWLAEARDWNVSRKRFWGTPIPVWRCEACAQERCMGSIAELEVATGAEVTDLHPHRIDHLTMACLACGGVSRRIADVFDCWFESGAMPYAQRHHPFEGAETFEEDFPAQFIAEGLDQTRGWFYTLLVLSTALYDRAPFKNCVVNGLVLAEDGTKMSKRKQNYPAPDRIFEEYGADALRAYLINSPIVRAEPLRFSERGVKEVVRTVLIPLRNAWSFFVQYANIDGWQPSAGAPPVSARPELDRWVLSVLQSLVGEVNTQMEGYFLYRVVPPVLGFIDDLTNWYIRRSRRRFWRSAEDAAGQADKAAAYATLYEVLVTFSQVLAPVLPFISDAMYQSLVVEVGAPGPDSVHLCDYPVVQEALIDRALEADVALARQVVSLGRALREQHRLKTRQPLRRVLVVHHEAAARQALATHADIIADELNVKAVAVVANDEALASLSFKADFKRLGKRLGARMKEGAAGIAALTGADWQVLSAGGTLEVAGIEITAEDVLVTRTPRGDVVILTEGGVTVALDTDLDPALVAEGWVREVQSRLQRMRKDSGLEVTDRIALTLGCADPELRAALEAHRVALAEEVLAESLVISEASESGASEGEVLDIDGRALAAALRRV